MRLATLSALVLLLPACDAVFGNPCQDYVDYVCDCHDGEAGYDCDTLRASHATDDVELYEDCTLELEAIKAADESTGLGCDAGDTGV